MASTATDPPASYRGTMTMPSAGWYPSPDGDPSSVQYWDGQQWTPHRSPAPDYQPGTPQSPLAGSGLRRVDALFGDAWTILRRAWWPITAVGLLLWSLWGLLVALFAAAADFGAWTTLLLDVMAADEAAPGALSAAESAEFEQRATDLLAQTATGVWIAAGVILTVAMIATAVAHSAAVYRLGAEAAAGRPATFATAWDGIRDGTLRLIGYGLLLSAASVLLAGVVVGAVVLLSGVPFLAVIVGTLGAVAWFAVLYGLMGKLVPAFVQASVPGGSGALGWSWRVTRGKFWAVLGRYLLWSLAASVLINLVTSVAALPLSFVFFGALFAGSAAGWLVLFVMLATIAVSAAASGFSYLGSVPIWRDLTADERYRAIEPDGGLS